jgi:hypothetical protein
MRANDALADGGRMVFHQSQRSATGVRAACRYRPRRASTAYLTGERYRLSAQDRRPPSPLAFRPQRAPRASCSFPQPLDRQQFAHCTPSHGASSCPALASSRHCAWQRHGLPPKRSAYHHLSSSWRAHQRSRPLDESSTVRLLQNRSTADNPSFCLSHRFMESIWMLPITLGDLR